MRSRGLQIRVDDRHGVHHTTTSSRSASDTPTTAKAVRVEHDARSVGRLASGQRRKPARPNRRDGNALMTSSTTSSSSGGETRRIFAWAVSTSRNSDFGPRTASTAQRDGVLLELIRHIRTTSSEATTPWIGKPYRPRSMPTSRDEGDATQERYRATHDQWQDAGLQS